MDEMDIIRQELRSLRSRVDKLEEWKRAREEADRRRDNEIRDGLLLIVRGTEKRLGIAKGAPIEVIVRDSAEV